MITEVVERVFADGLVCEVSAGADGSDGYLLGRRTENGARAPIVRVWVRPDGRFSRAEGLDGLLSIGQVWSIWGLTRPVPRPASGPVAVSVATEQLGTETGTTFSLTKALMSLGVAR